MSFFDYFIVALGVYALFQIEKRLAELVDQFRIED